MSRRIPPRTPPPPSRNIVTPAEASPAIMPPLKCLACNKSWPYTHTIQGPGGPIGIQFHLAMLGCPGCGSTKGYAAVVGPQPPKE